MSTDFNLLQIEEGLEMPRDTRSQVTRPRLETSNFGLETETMSRDLTSLHSCCVHPYPLWSLLKFANFSSNAKFILLVLNKLWFIPIIGSLKVCKLFSKSWVGFACAEQLWLECMICLRRKCWIGDRFECAKKFLRLAIWRRWKKYRFGHDYQGQMWVEGIPWTDWRTD